MAEGRKVLAALVDSPRLPAGKVKSVPGFRVVSGDAALKRAPQIGDALAGIDAVFGAVLNGLAVGRFHLREAGSLWAPGLLHVVDDKGRVRAWLSEVGGLGKGFKWQVPLGPYRFTGKFKARTPGREAVQGHPVLFRKGEGCPGSVLAALGAGLATSLPLGTTVRYRAEPVIEHGLKVSSWEDVSRLKWRGSERIRMAGVQTGHRAWESDGARFPYARPGFLDDPHPKETIPALLATLAED